MKLDIAFPAPEQGCREINSDRATTIKNELIDLIVKHRDAPYEVFTGLAFALGSLMGIAGPDRFNEMMNNAMRWVSKGANAACEASGKEGFMHIVTGQMEPFDDFPTTDGPIQ